MSSPTSSPARRADRRLPALLGAVLAALLTVGTIAPAEAADRPPQVGLVSFVGAALTGTSQASLTVSWPAAKTAAKYEVFVGTTYNNVLDQKSPRVTVTGTKAVIPGLARGKDHFVQVRAVNKAGKAGPKSSRVGHGTIRAEGSPSATKYNLLTWNICSNKCSKMSSRQKIINSRIGELSPDIVTLQESSEYTKAPSGYGFAFKGRNSVLYNKAVFSLAVAGEQTAFSARYTSNSGGGVSWGVLKNRSTGKLAVVFSAHLKAGTSASEVKQRVYESTRMSSVIRSTLAMLRVDFPSLDWNSAPTFVAGDINSNKSRTSDGTLATIARAGWHDAFDQARVLIRQHQNSTNGKWLATPPIGVRWGDHIDKVLVQPEKTVVVKWSHAQKMSKGKYVKLASDHLPILVSLRTSP